MNLAAAFSSRGIARRLGIESNERRLVFLMGALVAALFGAYTIAKVLRDAMFLAEFGALSLPYAYIGVALAAAGFVWLEGLVARRFTRNGALRFNQFAAIGFSVLAAIVLPLARHWAVAAFYVWTGSQAMMLLPHFWALALDAWDSRRARTIFPLLGGCGLLGGLIAGGFAAWAAPRLGSVGLAWLLAGLLVASHLLTRVVERQRARREATREPVSSASAFAIIGRSAYIQTLVVALALAVIVGTLVDFQFKLFVQHQYPDPVSLTRFFGQFYVGLNALSLLFQFSVAGWALKRLGLGTATALQPASALLFTALVALNPIWWAVIAVRWLQGVVFGTLGKSSSEIYYTAIRPRDRRRIKPAIDTLVERWSDAAVGLLLILLLHTLGAGAMVVAAVSVVLGVTWVIVLVVLNRRYGLAFEHVLSSRWLEPATDPAALRPRSARKALLAALHADDERRIVLALELSGAAGDPALAAAARECLAHASPAVRAAAIGALQAMGALDPEGAITRALGESHEGVRRAAVGYLLAQTGDASPFALSLLDGDDPALRQYVLDALFYRPRDAPHAVTPAWVDARIATGAREDLLVAARAAGTLTGGLAVPPLRALLGVDDIEVRRMALLSARRRPSAELLDALVPLLVVPALGREARDAVAAVGDAAIPALEGLLGGALGTRGQEGAALTLGRIATPRALAALLTLVRTGDVRLRHLGLKSMNRVRVVSGTPVVTRALAHKLFLRELADYRTNLDPAERLAGHAAPEVRLLAASFRESAEQSLERALHALACWYEPRPLAGAFGHLGTREPSPAAPALEYLSNLLPRSIFRPVTRIFEAEPMARAQEKDAAEAAHEDIVAEPIRSAWRWGDGWLRACAVRAARFAPTLDRQLFDVVEPEDALVRAEIAALAAEARPC